MCYSSSSSSPLSPCEWRGRPGPNRRRYGPRVSGKLSPRKMRRKKRGAIYRRRGLYCCLDENFSAKKCLFQYQTSPSIDDESLLFSFLGQRGKRGGKRGGEGTPFVFAMNGKIDERAEERDIYVYRTHAHTYVGKELTRGGFFRMSIWKRSLPPPWTMHRGMEEGATQTDASPPDPSPPHFVPQEHTKHY